MHAPQFQSSLPNVIYSTLSGQHSHKISLPLFHFITFNFVLSLYDQIKGKNDSSYIAFITFFCLKLSQRVFCLCKTMKCQIEDEQKKNVQLRGIRNGI
jgi:hypothetical protein